MDAPAMMIKKLPTIHAHTNSAGPPMSAAKAMEMHGITLTACRRVPRKLKERRELVMRFALFSSTYQDKVGN
jgi:hypothetical protein